LELSAAGRTFSDAEATTADANEVSDVGRELGGVGMNFGTGFRQPIP
jgi:hypothetical protein